MILCRDNRETHPELYEHERPQLSSAKRPQYNCRNDMFDEERVVLSCQKLVADFRFLLTAESLELLQSSFEKNIRLASEKMHSGAAPRSRTVTDTSNDSKFSPFVKYFPESMDPKFRLGSIMRMMFSQMQLKMKDFSPARRSKVFHQMFSRLVNNASIRPINFYNFLFFLT